MGAAVDEITVEELVRDPYEVYRRLRDAGPCVWLAPAGRYVVPRWEDVFALDENRAFTAAEPDSLMTRAMGLSMLRTDGDEHQRQRRAAHLVLRAKEFGTYWSGMLAGVADELLDGIQEAGRADLVRDFAGPYAARTLKLMLGLDDVADTDMQIWSQALIDGPHVCLGAFVARQQVGRAALPRMFERLPGLRLATGFEPRQVGWVFRGLASLEVTWGR